MIDIKQSIVPTFPDWYVKITQMWLYCDPIFDRILIIKIDTKFPVRIINLPYVKLMGAKVNFDHVWNKDAFLVTPPVMYLWGTCIQKFSKGWFGTSTKFHHVMLVIGFLGPYTALGLLTTSIHLHEMIHVSLHDIYKCCLSMWMSPSPVIYAEVLPDDVVVIPRTQAFVTLLKHCPEDVMDGLSICYTVLEHLCIDCFIGVTGDIEGRQTFVHIQLFMQKNFLCVTNTVLNDNEDIGVEL